MSTTTICRVPIPGAVRFRDPELLLYAGGLAVAIPALFAGDEPVAAWAPYGVLGAGLGLAVALLSRLLEPLGRIRRRYPWLLPAVTATGVTFVPLAALSIQGVAEVEIGILQDAATRWLRTGSPYPDVQALASATEAEDYNVYFPLLALAGMPSALLGDSAITDARWYLLLGSVLVLGYATRSARPALLFCALSPVGMVAAAGMTDLLPIALICAGLVFVARGDTAPGDTARKDATRSGVLLGLAAAAKLLSWPAVGVVFFAYRARRAAGATGRFCAVIGGVLVSCLVLPALVNVEAFWRNTISLPLGFEPVTLVARTPLPGYVLTSSGDLGRMVALLLLIAAGLGTVAWLAIRPPATVQSVAWRLAFGWTLLFSLATAARLGYFVFPVAVLAWVYLREQALSGPGVRQEHAHLLDRAAR